MPATIKVTLTFVSLLFVSQCRCNLCLYRAAHLVMEYQMLTLDLKLHFTANLPQQLQTCATSKFIVNILQCWAKEMELSWEKVSALLQPATAGHARLVLNKTVLLFCTTLYIQGGPTEVYSGNGSFIQTCAEKRDCFVKHQPGMAGCGWLQLGRSFLST